MSAHTIYAEIQAWNDGNGPAPAAQDVFNAVKLLGCRVLELEEQVRAAGKLEAVNIEDLPSNGAVFLTLDDLKTAGLAGDRG